MKNNIREARVLSFNEEIGSKSITVELNTVGWIIIRQFTGSGGMFGQAPKYANLHITTEDARNLIACLKELIPPNEDETKRQP